MPAPLAEPAIPRVDEVEVGSCRQEVEVHYRQDEELRTPLTPVSAEAFISLQNRIIQQDAHALDETSKQNLAKHLQKYTKAFQKSFALSVLQEDRIRFLTTINNEAKVRRSTKSLVLGKAKVMSYEDLEEEARAKRIVKEATRAAKGKGKRGRKRKNSTLEAEENTAEEDTAESARRGRKRKSAALDLPAPTTKMARISNAPKPASTLMMRQASRTKIVDDDEIAPELWRAPVAKMW
jgi:hypothetical protein